MIASEIVREYKENLEQAESGLFGDDDVDDDEGGLGLSASTNQMNGNTSAVADSGGGNSEYQNNSKQFMTLHVGLGSGDRAIEGDLHADSSSFYMSENTSLMASSHYLTFTPSHLPSPSLLNL